VCVCVCVCDMQGTFVLFVNFYGLTDKRTFGDR